MKIHMLSILILIVGFMPFTVLQAADSNARQSRNPEPEPGSRIVHPVDKSIMVYVPSGYFKMEQLKAELPICLIEFFITGIITCTINSRSKFSVRRSEL